MTQVSQGRGDEVEAARQRCFAEVNSRRLRRAASLGHLRHASENPTATAVSEPQFGELWRCSISSLGCGRSPRRALRGQFPTYFVASMLKARRMPSTISGFGRPSFLSTRWTKLSAMISSGWMM